MKAGVIAATLSYTKGTGLSTILLHRVDLGCAQKWSLNSGQVNHTKRATLQIRVCSYSYARTSVSNNGTINWSTMGPTLSIFIRNTENNNMSCDLMNNNDNHE